MKQKTLSKAESKEKRREQNKQWMLLNRSTWTDEDLNPRHTQYYQTQVPELKHGWDSFVSVMKKELPVTFRISSSCHDLLHRALAFSLEHEFARMKGHFITNKHGEVIDGPIVHTIDWMKDAYQLIISNKDLNEEAGCSKLASWLQREVNLGHIVRQELVSMIPAALLDIQHSHMVLDVCASPGSKTEQLLGKMVRSAREQSMLPTVSICTYTMHHTANCNKRSGYDFRHIMLEVLHS
ncbi:hypothetical protein EON63_00665 [archaeon]|nr:MAG: hypothetical protein EON63_00665 [archaeon]